MTLSRYCSPKIRVLLSVKDKHKEEVKKILEDAGIGYVKLGKPTEERHIW